MGSSTPNSPVNPLGTFKKLPMEIRQEIFAITNRKTEFEFLETGRILLPAMPLLQTSRCIRNEAARIIRHRNIVSVTTRKSLVRLIGTMSNATIQTSTGQTQLTHVKHLQIDLRPWLRIVQAHCYCPGTGCDLIPFANSCELDAWAKQLLPLSKFCSTITFRICSIDVDYRGKIKHFLRRVTTRYRLLSKGRMTCFLRLEEGFKHRDYGSYAMDGMLQGPIPLLVLLPGRPEASSQDTERK